jgi:hypothetical protein
MKPLAKVIVDLDGSSTLQYRSTCSACTIALEWIDAISIKIKMTENNTSTLFIIDFEFLPLFNRFSYNFASMLKNSLLEM